MHTTDLSGEWTLFGYPSGSRAIARPDDLDTAGLEAIPALVPGNVELDLVRAGRLPEPFWGENMRLLKPYEAYEWWYLRRLNAPAIAEGQRAELVFEGVDCCATIWLNGEIVGEAANMLIAHRFDVTGRLRPDGLNVLAVHLRPAVAAARGYRYEPGEYAFITNYESLRVRKAAHMYGWDIAPRAVSAGLWRPVTLEVHEPTELLEPYYATLRLEGDDAILAVNWQFATDAPTFEGFALRFSGVCGASRFEETIPAYFLAGYHRLRVPQAKLWWPKGYGAPELYDVTCELLRDGQALDRRTDRIGLRTVELERTPITTATEPGQFLFRVNGVPIQCRGSNWVPLDAFHSRDAARYAEVLPLFDDLGGNIVRCWGGNVYEDHAFFDYCDAHGIMVWQDFALACGFYPQDDEFLGVMREEATAVVHKLRNHPSLILWAGDNEIDAIMMEHGMDPAHNLISRRVLPEVCAACDPYRPYLESSPYVSPEAARRKRRDQTLMPEQHLWGPRDYFKGPFYAQNTAHFASEIGYHGCPNVSSLRRFIAPERLWPWQDNESWRIHASDPAPTPGPWNYRTKLMADQIHELFGIDPDNLDDFALASQISQAEAKKFFIELFRLHKWRRTGIIWWNVMDCWPQFSDAIVDYYGGKKLAYWYIRRVQTPVCLMIDEPEGWHCRVAATNDTLQPAAGRYRITDSEGVELLAGEYAIEPNGLRELGRLRVSHGDQRLFLITWEQDGRAYGNHYLLGKPPLSFAQYRAWLPLIAALPGGFDAANVAR